MTKDEALEMALEALENVAKDYVEGRQYKHNKAITAIKQALALAAQKPVAYDYRTKYDRGCYKCSSQFCPGNCIETTPPAAQPAQPAQPAQVSEYECRKLLYGFMLDCNAVGLEQAGKNLHRSMKEKNT
jgi:hypothetical protein